MKISSLIPGIFIGLLSTLFLFILFTDQQPLSKDEAHFSKLIDLYDRDINEIFPVANKTLEKADELARKSFLGLPNTTNISKATNAIVNFKQMELLVSVLEYQVKDIEAFNCENYHLKKKKESFLKSFYKQKKKLDQRKKKFLNFLDEKMKQNIPEKKDVFRI